jgi:hypothetical protein
MITGPAIPKVRRISRKAVMALRKYFVGPAWSLFGSN